VNVRRFWVIVCLLAVALAVTACGTTRHTAPMAFTLHGHEVGSEVNNGEYIQAGPITYQLQVSRELNPYSEQDKPYVQGLPHGSQPPNANEIWYGVFLWAKNQHHHPYRTASNFEIVDTQGNTYHPIDLDQSLNPFAWKPELLSKGETYPLPNSIQANGESQGGLLLFKLNDSAYSNRPLTLYVLNHNGRRLGSISLDL
jgi:hypothetical protein